MQKSLTRSADLNYLSVLIEEFPVVALIGARQVGKTTLARQFAKGYKADVFWYDLEDPADLARLRDPSLELRPLKGLVVLDEVHRLPEVFPLLRVLADRPEPATRFLVLGSASPDLLRQSSETLAGRIAFHQLDGLGLHEVDEIDRLWLRGGFPRSFLANSDAASLRWRRNFIETFLARDIAEFGGGISTTALRRFWTMLAHWHGQVWNGSEFGRAFGVSHTTIRRYLDLLTSLLVVRQLSPWFENINKRQVRSPKVYITDPGILHALLNLPNRDTIRSHPKIGASWEGFVIGQLAQVMAVANNECYHWMTQSGASLDLLVVTGGERCGFEIKRTDAPRLTASMHAAADTLKLDRLYFVHAGEKTFQLSAGVTALAAQDIASRLSPDTDVA